MKFTTLLILVKIGFSCGLTLTCLSLNGSTPIDYEHTEKLCCAGVLHAIREDIQPYLCCGADPYNPASQSCCNGQILDPAHNRSLGCCTSTNTEEVYNSDTQVCCQGTLANKAEGIACCGNAAIDTTHQTCCSNGPRDGLGQCCGLDKLYNASSEICCQWKEENTNTMSRVHTVGEDAVIDETAGCCVLEAINTREQHCCHQVPQEKTAFSECCGQTTFDLRSEVCCMDTKSALTNGRTECCGSNPYNPDNEACCGFTNEVVYPIGHGNCCRESPYSPQLESCCGGRKQSLPIIKGIQGCCGSKSYLKTEHLCCWGRKFQRQPNMECCGAGIYNTTSTTEMCCDNRKLNRTSPSLQCCGNTSYDPQSETCCHRAAQSFPVAGLSCCYADSGREAGAFDPTRQTCCSGNKRIGVFDESAVDGRCCGSVLLQANQLCDARRQQPINKTHPDHDAVCRPVNERTGKRMLGSMPVTYDSEDQFCTIRGDLTIRLSGEEACGRSIYDHNTELCCAGQVHNKHDPYRNSLECCGNSIKVFSPSLQCCFAGKVSNVPREVAGLCRNTIYNTNTSACDRSGLVRPRCQVEAFPDLCGTSSDFSSRLPYNRADNECCRDVLIGPGQTCCEGQVYDTPGTALGEGECCRHDGGYNADMHICCKGRLFPTTGTDMECCGPRPHEPLDNSHICCKDRLYAAEGGRTLCTDGTLHSAMETVCDEVRYDVANGQCCGKEIMDDTKICCQGLIYSKEDHGTQCCGKIAYDPSAQPLPLCCIDTLYPDASGLQCCGNQAINPNERQCCGEEGHRFAFLRSSGHTCCGKTPGDYDLTQHTCCQGLLHMFLQNGECCGNNVVRDPSKEVCCGGLIKSKRYKEDTLCCNGNILDSHRFTCCGNVKLLRRSRSPDKCCNGILFNRHQQLCVAGEVQARDIEETTDNARRIFTRQTEHAQRFTRDATDTEEDSELTTEAEGQTAHVQVRMIPLDSTDATELACNGLDYNAQVQGCCQGVLYRLANETCMNGLVLGLCDGQSVYNPLNHGCCAGRVYNLSIEYCDETTTLVGYSSGSSKQGNDTITSTSAPEKQLCGGEVYNQTLQGCCDDRLYNLIVEYCHNGSTVMPNVPSQPDRRESTTAFTTTAMTESTTDNGFMVVTPEPCSVILKRENASEELACCGSLLYDPLNATCCQGITDQGDETVVAWSAVTEGVVAGRCCAETAYDSTLAVCCNEEVIGRVWLTPDIFDGCCPEREQWNRIIEECEIIPTWDPIMIDGSSGMPPEDHIW